MKWRRGIAAGLVALVGILAGLAMTSPWSSEPDRGEQSRAERESDPLAFSRKLVGGKARSTECRDRGRTRICQVEGPAGEKAICLLFGGGDKGEPEFSCFDRSVGERR